MRVWGVWSINRKLYQHKTMWFLKISIQESVYKKDINNYSDVIMGAIATQITTLTMAYSTVYSGADFTCVYPKCSMYWWVIRKLCCYLCMNWIRVSDHIACFVKNVAYMLRLGVIYTVIYLIIFNYIHPNFFSMSVVGVDCHAKNRQHICAGEKRFPIFFTEASTDVCRTGLPRRDIAVHHSELNNASMRQAYPQRLD